MNAPKTFVTQSRREEFQISANDSQITHTRDWIAEGVVPDIRTPELKASKANARRHPARDSIRTVVTD